VLKIVPRN